MGWWWDTTSFPTPAQSGRASNQPLGPRRPRPILLQSWPAGNGRKGRNKQRTQPLWPLVSCSYDTTSFPTPAALSGRASNQQLGARDDQDPFSFNDNLSQPQWPLVSCNCSYSDFFDQETSNPATQIAAPQVKMMNKPWYHLNFCRKRRPFFWLFFGVGKPFTSKKLQTTLIN